MSDDNLDGGGHRTIKRAETSFAPFDARPYLELRVWADTFAQIQRDRIALNNRLLSGVLPEDIVAELIDNYRRSEHMVGLAMRRSFRRAAPEVVKWMKTDAAVGVGEHLLARLIGTIGHPVIAQPHHWVGEGSERVLVVDEPFERNVAKLWAYCGMGDPTRKRVRGMTADDATGLGNPRAKMLCRLIAESCIKCVGSSSLLAESRLATTTDTISENVDSTKRSEPNIGTSDVLGSSPAESMSTADSGVSRPRQGDLSTDDDIQGSKPQSATRRRSPYRDVYDATREKYAEREDWTLMHKHNAALRRVSKEFLKDLWVVARDQA